MLLDLFSVEYGPASVTTRDTHDGFRKKKPHVDPEETKRIGHDLRKRELEKLAYAERLRNQLRGLPDVERIIEELPAEIQQIITSIDEPNRTVELEALLFRAEMELNLIQQSIKTHQIRARREKDEEDIRAILMAMSAPFRTFH